MNSSFNAARQTASVGDYILEDQHAPPLSATRDELMSRPTLPRNSCEMNLIELATEPPKPRTTATSEVTRTWSWEILAAVISTASLTIVATCLTVMSNRRLADWELPGSLNAIVSVFITSAKAALLMLIAEGISQLKWAHFAEKKQRLYDLQMFDNASRGPWGGLVLLLTCKLKPILACVGAITTILALAMDPCAQQILQARMIMMESLDDAATICTATAYDIAMREGSGISSFAGIDLILNVTNSLYAGMFHGSLKSQVAHVCLTANCTWNSFQSLGVCSKCMNETDSATVACVSSNTTVSESTELYTQQDCNYTTMNGITLQARTSYEHASQLHNSTVLQSVVETRPWTSGDLGAQLANISIIRFGPQLEWHLPRPAIYTCEISLCQKMFHPSVVNGTLLDSVIHTQSLRFPQCLFNASNSRCSAFALSEPTTSESVEPVDIWISTDAVTSMGTIIKTLLTHNNSNIGMKRLALSPEALMASMLWKLNKGNIPQTIDDITTSMTNSIREGPNATWIEGKAMTPTVTVHVNWWWFSLPLAVWMLSVAFLVATMAKSRDQRVPVWKSSILSTVFCQLDETYSVKPGKDPVRDMEIAAKNMKVLLTPDSSGRLAFCR